MQIVVLEGTIFVTYS